MDEFSRKLPFSLIAEQSLLGSILVDPEAITEVSDIVQPTDFYLSEHTQIYSAMCNLFIASKEIDIVTLIDTLVSSGVYSKSGGEDYIKTLYQAVPNALNVKEIDSVALESYTQDTNIPKLNAVSTEITTNNMVFLGFNTASEFIQRRYELL